IGLIEAMGLFILPTKMKKQLDMIADILSGNAVYDEKEIADENNYLYVHRNMIKELMAGGKVSTKEEAEKLVKNKVNETCKNILFNTAVFKKDENGVNGFKKFLKTCNLEV
ncbi:MAG: galactose-1-phosphate uridylyltransferase, partial [Clostridia bacterium]|nr:galactose-1-phosphate uridylyltransferase [Clostridia bacterium]